MSKKESSDSELGSATECPALGTSFQQDPLSEASIYHQESLEDTFIHCKEPNLSHTADNADSSSAVLSASPSAASSSWSRQAEFGESDEEHSLSEYDRESCISQYLLTSEEGEATAGLETADDKSFSSVGTANTNHSSLPSCSKDQQSEINIGLHTSSQSFQNSQDNYHSENIPESMVYQVSANPSTEIPFAYSRELRMSTSLNIRGDPIAGTSYQRHTSTFCLNTENESVDDLSGEPGNDRESSGLRSLAVEYTESTVSLKIENSYYDSDKSTLTSHESVPSMCNERLDFWPTTSPQLQATNSSLKYSFGDLPREVLLKIVQYIPTASLIACTEVHYVFADLLSDIHFLDRYTRSLLGFPPSQKDITYNTVPAPVEPVQHLWFQTYLHRVAPYLNGVVRPGVVFYSLLCFKHLLDTWLLQGRGYKYWMFVSDVIKSTHQPPLSISTEKRLLTVSRRMVNIITKLALCNPKILLATLNDFEEFSISQMPPSELDDAWEQGVPSEWKGENLEEICEVVSRQRGLNLASFFLGFNRQCFFGWSGIIDCFTFRFKETWGLCNCSAEVSLEHCRQISQDLFSQFLNYTGQQYISLYCSNAFFFRSLNKLVLHRLHLMPQVQDLLEKTALSIHMKLKKCLPREKFGELKFFFDKARFVGCSSEAITKNIKKLNPRELSKTTEVAVQRYLHRYLNTLLGQQVLQLYIDPVCHHLLCISCRNTHSINTTPFSVCMERVGPQSLPLKIWPPHLLHQALLSIPALAKIVRLDIELWTRNLLGLPLSEKVKAFVGHILGCVFLDFVVDQKRRGIIVQRLTKAQLSFDLVPVQCTSSASQYVLDEMERPPHASGSDCASVDQDRTFLDACVSYINISRLEREDEKKIANLFL